MGAGVSLRGVTALGTPTRIHRLRLFAGGGGDGVRRAGFFRAQGLGGGGGGTHGGGGVVRAGAGTSKLGGFGVGVVDVRAPPGVSPKMLLSRRGKEVAGASGQWLRGWWPMELWGSYAGPGLHVPGIALACAEDRYSFCGTKRRGGGAAGRRSASGPSGSMRGRRTFRSVGARVVARRRETRWTDSASIRRRPRSRRDSGGSFRGRVFWWAHLRVFARAGAESERRFRDFPRVHLFAEEGHQSLFPHGVVVRGYAHGARAGRRGDARAVGQAVRRGAIEAPTGRSLGFWFGHVG